MEKIFVGGLYRHYKNKNLYKVIGLAKLKSDLLDDLEPSLVVYEDRADSSLYVRDKANFLANLNYEGKIVKRFSFVV